MTDLIIVLVGSLIILSLGTSWVWNNLVRQLKELSYLKDELDEGFAHRRDTIPYLVESYRGVVLQNNPAILDLIQERARIYELKSFGDRLKEEEILTASLNNLFEKTRQNGSLQHDIGWLEARTEIQKIAEEVVVRQQRYSDLHLYISNKIQEFPYVLFKKPLEQKL